MGRYCGPWGVRGDGGGTSLEPAPPLCGACCAGERDSGRCGAPACLSNGVRGNVAAGAPGRGGDVAYEGRLPAFCLTWTENGCSIQSIVVC